MIFRIHEQYFVIVKILYSAECYYHWFLDRNSVNHM